MKRGKTREIVSAGCVLGVCLFAGNALALTTVAMDNATNMAQSLVGAGVTISNATYTGAAAASGYFSGGTAAGIGIESGIVMTSGSIANLNGSANTSSGITGDNGWDGYGPLDALNPGYTTHDASVLAFDFTTVGNAAYFTYAFGSDEYNEYVNTSYSDVFGFFLNGTAVSDNQALIPGTATPVSINNVNNGANSVYYVDNESGGLPFEYDGVTVPLQVAMTGLTPGDTYHLTLAIADAGDWSLDSGVFIGAGTLSEIPDPDIPGGGGNAPVPEPATMLLFATGLIGFAGYSRKKMQR